jgi:hypothetical protein
VAVAEVNTQTATQSSASSVTVTKPTSTASGHLLLAFFTSNSQNCTPPSGWTEISDEVVEVFRLQVFYKVAGGSEPANYTFSVGSNAPLVCSITALSGVDSSNPIDISPEVETATGNHAEPYTTPSVTGGIGGALVYFRAARRESTTPLTFTGAGATELADVGVAGSTVSYSQGVYLAYTTSGTKTGLGINCSATESHNIVGTLGVRAVAVPGSMEVGLPLVQADMAGNPAIPGEVDFGLPHLEFEGEGFYGNTEGTLDVEVPISMEMDGGSPPAGTLDATILPVFDLLAETRKFAENVVVPDRDERWLIVDEESLKLGLRKIRYLPLKFELPSLRAQFVGDLPPFGFPPDPIPVTANAATWRISHHEQAPVSASATANNATIARGEIPNAGAVTATVTANPATVAKTKSVSAGTVTVSVTAFDVRGVQATPVNASATVTANNATVLRGTKANAGHASVSCHN